HRARRRGAPRLLQRRQRHGRRDGDAAHAARPDLHGVPDASHLCLLPAASAAASVPLPSLAKPGLAYPARVPVNSASSPAPLLVLAAMAEEAAAVAALLGDPEPLEAPLPSPVAAVRGRVGSQELVVVTTGIGIAAATTAATWAILELSPRAVVAAGSCGGLAADV